MTLVALRSSIVSSIDTEISAFKAVQAHGGRFDRAELNRLATQAPIALVTILGGKLEREGSQAVGAVRVVVFVMTRGSSSSRRDEAALILIEAVAGLVAENKWAYADAKAPDPNTMRIDNLYNGQIDRTGVALWSASWIQRADLAIYDPEALPELHQINVDMDLAPADGIIEYESVIQVWGELMAAYGHIYVSTSAATSISVVDTYQKLAGTTTLKLESDCDMPANNRLRHTGTVVKPFAVKASGAISVSGNAEVTLALAEGGVVDENTAVPLDVTSAEGAKPFSLDGIFNLDENEYVEIWVKADDTINVTAEAANLVGIAT